MKKETAYLWLSAATFVVGFWVSFPFHWMLQWRSDTRELDQFRKSAAKIEQGIYGENRFHTKGIDPESDARLASFDPATSEGFIALNIGAFVYGRSRSLSLKLFGNGELIEEMDGKRRLVTTVEASRCKAFFLRVLTSGIMNFSPEVVELKKEICDATGMSRTFSTASRPVEIHVFVPELDADRKGRKGRIIGRLCEEENYPRVIEFQYLTQIQEEMLALVPEGFSLWKWPEGGVDK